jgi:outer membrane protein OmpA-like peptidoglycan-associated protein
VSFLNTTTLIGSLYFTAVTNGGGGGGTAGALIGRHMDKQAEEMRRDLEGAKVERVGEGIKITFDSGILFDFNKSELRSQAKENIDKLAVILLKYPDTNILVAGHTDASGSDDYNQKLSESRANTVANYAKGRGVEGARFTVVGYGESDPVASNDTPQGMQQNRRVEIAIFANEKMKKAADNGTL